MTCHVKIQWMVLEILTVWGAGFSGIILPSTSRPTGSILCLQNTIFIIFLIYHCPLYLFLLQILFSLLLRYCNRHKKECYQFFASQAKLLIVTACMLMYTYVHCFQFSHNEIRAYTQGSVKIGKFTKINNPFCYNYWINWGSSYINITSCYPGMMREVGGVLCSNSLFGMCHWMGLHFHNWTDYNKVEFNTVTWMGSHTFGILGIRIFW